MAIDLLDACRAYAVLLKAEEVEQVEQIEAVEQVVPWKEETAALVGQIEAGVAELVDSDAEVVVCAEVADDIVAEVDEHAVVVAVYDSAVDDADDTDDGIVAVDSIYNSDYDNVDKELSYHIHHNIATALEHSS